MALAERYQTGIIHNQDTVASTVRHFKQMYTGLLPTSVDTCQKKKQKPTLNQTKALFWHLNVKLDILSDKFNIFLTFCNYFD